MRVAFLAEAGDPHGLTALADRLNGGGEIAATVVHLPPASRDDLWVQEAHKSSLDVDQEPAGAGVPPADLIVATGWRTAAALDAVPAGARALLLMEMEDRALPAGSADAEAAAAIFTLPVPVVVPARWMAEQLAQLRPAEAPAVHVVAPGVDRDVFAIPDALARDDRAPLRVLVLEPAGGGGEASAAAAAMREPATVARLDPGTAPPAARAAAYAAADVVLALPRIAGFPRAPLEAFHLGATCVMTPVSGHDEHLVDGANGLLVSWDDERGTSRLLDLLARDRELLGRLRGSALETARGWPTADAAAASLAGALTTIVDGARTAA